MNKVVILSGGRLPFQPSGTIYKNLSNFDLAQKAILGCLQQSGIQTNKIDHVFAIFLLEHHLCRQLNFF